MLELLLILQRQGLFKETDKEKMEQITALLKSRKFVVSVLAVICVTLLSLSGKVDAQATLDFCKYILSVWLASHALEEGLTRGNT